MKLTASKFCKKFNLEPQLLDSLLKQGVIALELKSFGKAPPRKMIEEDEFKKLKEGHDFVRCPFCFKGFGTITKRHYKHCSKAPTGVVFEDISSGRYIKNHVKTEEQKEAQSLNLKSRFKTLEGEITRQQISVSSRNYNSKPEVRAWKREYFGEISRRPERREVNRQASLKMWREGDQREKISKYVEENRDKVERGAAKARKGIKKVSKIHLRLKAALIKAGLLNFQTEYFYKYYKVDEADPFLKIAIEVDGCYWHDCLIHFPNGGSGRGKLDKSKNTFLKNRGWVVLRFWEHDILQDLNLIVEEVRKIVNQRKFKCLLLTG